VVREWGPSKVSTGLPINMAGIQGDKGLKHGAASHQRGAAGRGCLHGMQTNKYRSLLAQQPTIGDECRSHCKVTVL
jgi:hypothetical protein